jgi:hypothetical protein|mmetsp:Transcript_86789/g.144836  ORF Transcript_86789/g.144836 Transcript_86789/m.144836 type:complete len:98 (-) Transcript_86789:82-375(-)
MSPVFFADAAGYGSLSLRKGQTKNQRLNHTHTPKPDHVIYIGRTSPRWFGGGGIVCEPTGPRCLVFEKSPVDLHKVEAPLSMNAMVPVGRRRKSTLN